MTWLQNNQIVNHKSLTDPAIAGDLNESNPCHPAGGLVLKSKTFRPEKELNKLFLRALDN